VFLCWLGFFRSANLAALAHSGGDPELRENVGLKHEPQDNDQDKDKKFHGHPCIIGVNLANSHVGTALIMSMTQYTVIPGLTRNPGIHLLGWIPGQARNDGVGICVTHLNRLVIPLS
jgi:hypothetical protein